jgi:uncharacterized repeat protein (TIGR01451 family)
MAAFFLGAAPALAGIGGSAVPDFPDTVNVGQTFTGTLTITNTSNGSNLTENVQATGIFMTPSCVAGFGTCATPDPGVFQIGTTGTGSGACAGQTFNIAEVNAATGEVEFTPTSGNVVLGPANGSNNVCVISFDVTVLKVPQDNDAGQAGIQTDQLGRVQLLRGLTTNDTGQAAGSDTTTVTAASLTVVKTPDGQTINAGDTATFTIVITNTGTGTATSVTLNDPLPAGGGVNWTTSTPNCSVSGAPGAQTLTCNLGDLAAGASTTVTVSAVTSAQACTTMPNLATADATNTEPASDPGSITCIPPPNLTIVKTPDGQTINPGDTATFTIVVSNTGPGSATNVVVTDPLPAGGGLNWTTATPNCSVSGAPGAQTLTCNLGTLAASASVTITVSAVTSLEMCTTMPNLATATAGNNPPVSDPGSITCNPPVSGGICRTPGFWGTHGCGTSGSLDPAQCEKVRGSTTRAQNITQLALNVAMDKAGGSLTICGEVISNTEVGSGESAIEAICVKPSTDQSAPLQVARQLMSAALNCAISNDDLNAAYCAGTSSNDIFEACNTECATASGKTVTAEVDGFTISCGAALDCLNNGFVFHLDTGVCGPETTGCHDETLTNVGACSLSGDLCSSNDPCAAGAGECRPGPAGSSKACNTARDNDCTIFGGC